MQSHLRKACPRCQTPANLSAPYCVFCGHQYRTRFVAPLAASPTVHPTRKLYVLVPDIKDVSARQAAAGLGALIALTGLFSVVLPVRFHHPPYYRVDKVRLEKPPARVRAAYKFTPAPNTAFVRGDARLRQSQTEAKP